MHGSTELQHERGGGVNGSNAFHTIFDKIASLENLFGAWREFRRGKRKKRDVQEFEFRLEDNLFQLHEELQERTYRHSPYTSFFIRDPKPRHIHKASVRDRVVHQAVFRVLYPLFDRSFIFDSYSCRFSKGTHGAVSRLEKFSEKLSKNYTQTIFALKCDIRKFFDTVDHNILVNFIRSKVEDPDTLWLVERIIHSFEKTPGKGLPLGNVTSQLFANIYLNPFDQFVKHTLRMRYYLRYCDDFIILGTDPHWLRGYAAPIQEFLSVRLNLSLHHDKIIVRKLGQGIDFLGYVVLPYYRVLRTRTKRRMLRMMDIRRQQLANGLVTLESFECSKQSYLGMLMHCRGYKIKQTLLR